MGRERGAARDERCRAACALGCQRRRLHVAAGRRLELGQVASRSRGIHEGIAKARGNNEHGVGLAGRERILQGEGLVGNGYELVRLGEHLLERLCYG